MVATLVIVPLIYEHHSRALGEPHRIYGDRHRVDPAADIRCYTNVEGTARTFADHPHRRHFPQSATSVRPVRHNRADYQRTDCVNDPGVTTTYK